MVVGATDLVGTGVTGLALGGANIVTEAASSGLYFTEGVGEAFGVDLGLEDTADSLSDAVTLDGLGEQLFLDLENLGGATMQATGGIQSLWDLEAGTELAERGRSEQARVKAEEASGAGLTGAAGTLDTIIDLVIPTGGALKFGGKALTAAGRARLANTVVYQKIAGAANKYRKTTIISLLTPVVLAAAETLAEIDKALKDKGATTQPPPGAEVVESEREPRIIPEQTTTAADIDAYWAGINAANSTSAEANRRANEEARARREAEAASQEAALAEMLAANELYVRQANEAAAADAQARLDAAAKQRTDMSTLKSNLLTMARPIVEKKVSETFNQLIDTEKERKGLSIGVIPTVLTVVDGVMGQLMGSSPDEIANESYVADIATQAAMFYIDRFARDYAGVEWNEEKQRFES
jgi:hypothetical protein